jgi:hypothetical protein
VQWALWEASRNEPFEQEVKSGPRKLMLQLVEVDEQDAPGVFEAYVRWLSLRKMAS